MQRCGWAQHELSIAYHDKEWGKITKDDRVLYEFLVLEGAQAGLSWLTVLKKREGYREAFADFDYVKVAEYDDNKIEELRQNPNIIRNRLKIKSAITNARHFIEVQNEFGSFYKYLWSFTGGKQVVNSNKTMEDMPITSELSDRISKDLKKRGFKFVGSTIIYSYLQAVGVINDHLESCSFK